MKDKNIETVKDETKAILLWEDNSGKFHSVDAEIAIPNIVAEMRKNLETYKTLTIKLNSSGGSVENV